jgi:hypothetical protein
MTRFAWRLVGLLSELLEPDERSAVCGDFQELHVTSGRALGDLLGLVVRRQAALWMDWRPWAALIALAVPVGVVLSLLARQIANSASVYVWAYGSWWTRTILTIPAARQDLAGILGRCLLNFAALAVWSWTAGATLGALSRRVVNVTATAFYLTVFAGTFGSVTTGEANPFNSAVFSLPFFSLVVPVLVKTAVVSLPALAGLHRGMQGPRFPPLGMMLAAAGGVALTVHSAAAIEGSILSIHWQFGHWRGDGSLLQGTWLLALAPVAVAWPSVYLAAAAGWKRSHPQQVYRGEL